MKGFISIDSSLQEYYDFINTKGANQHPLFDDVKIRYAEELRKWNDSDNTAYENCKTVSDCRKYIAIFCNVYFYIPLHRHEVYEKMEDLIWEECQGNEISCVTYLKKYPNGRYVKEAKKCITKGNIKLTILITISVITCITIIALLAFFL